MATKNIEININNGNGYDILYPKTVVANIEDLSSNYYNKTESNNTFYNKSYINNNYYTKTDIDKMVKNSSEWINEGTYWMRGSKTRISRGISGKDFRGKDVLIQLNSVSGSITAKVDTRDCYISVEYGGGITLNMNRIYQKKNKKYCITDFSTANWKPFARFIPMTSGSWATTTTLDSMGYLAISSETESASAQEFWSNFCPSTWGEMSEVNVSDDSNKIILTATNVTTLANLRYSVTIYTKSIPVYTK